MKALAVESELIPSHGGVFEVTVDGKRLFSKKQLGRFPDEGEILGLIRAGKRG
jgi:selenoprotein W-related protein